MLELGKYRSLLRGDVWTNVAYVVVAFFVGSLALRFGLLLLALGSAGYHWTFDEDWRKLDHFGMYAVAVGLLGYGLGWGDWVTVLVMFASFPLVLFVDLDEGMAALFGMAIGVLHAWCAAFVLGIAIVINRVSFRRGRHGDGFGLWHGLWHVLSALGIWLMVK